MKLNVFLLISALAVIGAFIILSFMGLNYFQSGHNTQYVRIIINDTRINARLADNIVSRNRGLAGTKELAPDSGMLFVFDKSGLYSFWMKDMLIPLDFIWINNGQIVEITKNVQPTDYQPPKMLTPTFEVNSVLEVTADTAQKYNWQVGDWVTFKY